MSDKKYILECIDLSRKALKKGKNPFACLIVDKQGKVLSKKENGPLNKLYQHAEMLAMQEASRKIGSQDLSECTLYSNAEPCPMCSFMIREYKVKKVVFAIRSPLMGGYSKWNILEDKDLSRLKPIFSDPPKIIMGIEAEKAKEVFEEAGWNNNVFV